MGHSMGDITHMFDQQTQHTAANGLLDLDHGDFRIAPLRLTQRGEGRYYIIW
jgi:hypothetical protein